MHFTTTFNGWITFTSRRSARCARGAAAVLLALGMAGALTGCQTTQQNFAELNAAKAQTNNAATGSILHEGDSVRVSFPGAPNLNPGVQQIRPDGKISLPLIGEFKAAGLTTAEVQKQLMKLYESQLQSKEVIVTLESSTFTVYVTGAVLHSGKVTSDRPMTVLQAIMEAGGFDPNRANPKKVAIIRHLPDRTERFTVDLKRVMDGKAAEDFTLKPSDIISVPEKFSWF